MPEEHNENFWVREWIPQIELSHTLPYRLVSLIVASVVPVVAFPHFFDQHDNATEMEKRKVALILANRGLKLEPDMDKLLSYKEPAFYEKKVYKVFNEILTNEIYG